MEKKKKKKETESVSREKKPRGGARPGAGRKKGVKVGPYLGSGSLRDKSFNCRVSEETHRRIQMLREITKEEDVRFNRMFEDWVYELCREYGID